MEASETTLSHTQTGETHSIVEYTAVLLEQFGLGGVTKPEVVQGWWWCRKGW